MSIFILLIKANPLVSLDSSISNSLLEPLLDNDDDPKWAKAMASPECEFWIAGAQDEL